MSASDRPIRFGILGCADIARKVSRAILLSPNATLQAVASRSIQKAVKFAAENNFPETAKTYGDYNSLLDDPEIDAVYVPLPTSMHAEWAVSAARKGKHVLLEKPVACNAKEFDEIARVCEENGVQFMDGTMWVHHPRVEKMTEFVTDTNKFGQLKTFMDGTMWVHHPRVAQMMEFVFNLMKFGELKTIQSCFSFAADSNFLNNDIRVKPDLDGLGALGDAGWYCTRFSLWANNFNLPKTVIAFRDPVLNDSGVILSCGASLHWEDGKVASFHCSFLANLTMNATAVGTKGTLHLRDFIIPFEEKKASFLAGTELRFDDLMTGWAVDPSEHVVINELPQEACMVREFANLVKGIKVDGKKPEKKWPVYSRKTQLVLDAVKVSIDKGFVPVEVVY